MKKNEINIPSIFPKKLPIKDILKALDLLESIEHKFKKSRSKDLKEDK